MESPIFDVTPAVQLSAKELSKFRAKSNEISTANRAQAATVEWFAEKLAFPCCMVTLTLKKRLPGNKLGSAPEFMNKELGIKLAKRLRNKFLRSIYGSAYRARKINPAFLACYEEGEGNNQPHLHVIFNMPEGMTIDQAHDEMARCWRKCSKWSLWKTDVQNIYDKEGIVSYITKTGLDSVVF